MPSGVVRARTWQAKPLSQMQLEAETARLHDRDDYMRQRIKDDRHLLHQIERMQLHNGYGHFGRRVPGVGYGYGGLHTPGLGMMGSPGLHGVGVAPGLGGVRRRMSMFDGLAGRQALDAGLQIREMQLREQDMVLRQRERRLSHERDMVRLRQLEDQAMLRGRATVGNYGLSPRIGAFEGPMLDPLPMSLNSPYLGASGSYIGASPYIGTAAAHPAHRRMLDFDPLGMQYASSHMHELAYLDVPTHTPGRLGMSIGTPRAALIDPPLF